MNQSREAQNLNLLGLWGLETLGIRERNEVYDNLINNITFNGITYSVKLPWKAGNFELPDHKELSLQRLEGQLRRLCKHPDFAQEYHQVIKDQLKEHIIEEVDETMNNENQLHYLPHQAILRTDAETTPLRVVFDASAKLGKDSHSLNDCLHVGPSLTPLMYNVLLRFCVCTRWFLLGTLERPFYR